MKNKIYKNRWLASLVLGAFVLSTVLGPLAPAWADNPPLTQNPVEQQLAKRPVTPATSPDGSQPIGDAIRRYTSEKLGNPITGFKEIDVTLANPKIRSSDFNGVQKSKSGDIMGWDGVGRNVGKRITGKDALSNEDVNRVLAALNLPVPPRKPVSSPSPLPAPQPASITPNSITFMNSSPLRNASAPSSQGVVIEHVVGREEGSSQRPVQQFEVESRANPATTQPVTLEMRRAMADGIQRMPLDPKVREATLVELQRVRNAGEMAGLAAHVFQLETFPGSVEGVQRPAKPGRYVCNLATTECSFNKNGQTQPLGGTPVTSDMLNRIAGSLGVDPSQIADARMIWPTIAAVTVGDKKSDPPPSPRPKPEPLPQPVPQPGPLQSTRTLTASGQDQDGKFVTTIQLDEKGKPVSAERKYENGKVTTYINLHQQGGTEPVRAGSVGLWPSSNNRTELGKIWGKPQPTSLTLNLRSGPVTLDQGILHLKPASQQGKWDGVYYVNRGLSRPAGLLAREYKDVIAITTVRPPEGEINPQTYQGQVGGRVAIGFNEYTTRCAFITCGLSRVTYFGYPSGQPPAPVPTPQPDPKPRSIGPQTLQNFARAIGVPVTDALRIALEQTLKSVSTPKAKEEQLPEEQRALPGNGVRGRVTFQFQGTTYLALVTGDTLHLEKTSDGKLALVQSVRLIERLPQPAPAPVPAPQPIKSEGQGAALVSALEQLNGVGGGSIEVLHIPAQQVNKAANTTTGYAIYAVGNAGQQPVYQIAQFQNVNGTYHATPSPQHTSQVAGWLQGNQAVDIVAENFIPDVVGDAIRRLPGGQEFRIAGNIKPLGNNRFEVLYDGFAAKPQPGTKFNRYRTAGTLRQVGNEWSVDIDPTPHQFVGENNFFPPPVLTGAPQSAPIPTPSVSATQPPTAADILLTNTRGTLTRLAGEMLTDPNKRKGILDQIAVMRIQDAGPIRQQIVQMSQQPNAPSAPPAQRGFAGGTASYTNAQGQLVVPPQPIPAGTTSVTTNGTSLIFNTGPASSASTSAPVPQQPQPSSSTSPNQNVFTRPDGTRIDVDWNTHTATAGTKSQYVNVAYSFEVSRPAPPGAIVLACTGSLASNCPIGKSTAYVGIRGGGMLVGIPVQPSPAPQTVPTPVSGASPASSSATSASSNSAVPQSEQSIVTAAAQATPRPPLREMPSPKPVPTPIPSPQPLLQTAPGSPPASTAASSIQSFASVSPLTSQPAPRLAPALASQPEATLASATPGTAPTGTGSAGGSGTAQLSTNPSGVTVNSQPSASAEGMGRQWRLVRKGLGLTTVPPGKGETLQQLRSRLEEKIPQLRETMVRLYFCTETQCIPEMEGSVELSRIRSGLVDLNNLSTEKEVARFAQILNVDRDRIKGGVFHTFTEHGNGSLVYVSGAGDDQSEFPVLVVKRDTQRSSGTQTGVLQQSPVSVTLLGGPNSRFLGDGSVQDLDKNGRIIRLRGKRSYADFSYDEQGNLTRIVKINGQPANCGSPCRYDTSLTFDFQTMKVTIKTNKGSTYRMGFTQLPFGSKGTFFSNSKVVMKWIKDPATGDSMALLVSWDDYSQPPEEIFA